MPKSRYLKSFGIVVFLIAVGCVIWTNEGIVSGKSDLASMGTISRSQEEQLHQKQDGGSTRRVTRELNAESRVRSLLQIAPGEVGSIRIPSSGLGSLLSDEQEESSENIPLIPITRELAIQGLEEILHNGDSLSSRVDICNGKIKWQDEGVAVNGEMTELGDGVRNVSLAIEGKDMNGLSYKSVVSTSPQGYSFFLVRIRDSDVGGVLLVFGEDAKPGK